MKSHTCSNSQSLPIPEDKDSPRSISSNPQEPNLNISPERKKKRKSYTKTITKDYKTTKQNISVKLQKYASQVKVSVNNAQKSLEPSSVSQARELLFKTQQQIERMARHVENVYKAKKTEFEQIQRLSATLISISPSTSQPTTSQGTKIKRDCWLSFINLMGETYAAMDVPYEILLEGVLARFVEPIRDFKANDIANCMKSKGLLRTVRNKFDFCKHNVAVLREKYKKNVGNDAGLKQRLREAEENLEEATKRMESEEKEFVKLVREAVVKKNTELVSQMEGSWDCFLHFHGMLLQAVWQCTNDMQVIPNEEDDGKKEEEEEEEEDAGRKRNAHVYSLKDEVQEIKGHADMSGEEKKSEGGKLGGGEYKLKLLNNIKSSYVYKEELD